MQENNERIYVFNNDFGLGLESSNANVRSELPGIQYLLKDINEDLIESEKKKEKVNKNG